MIGPFFFLPHFSMVALCLVAEKKEGGGVSLEIFAHRFDSGNLEAYTFALLKDITNVY